MTAVHQIEAPDSRVDTDAGGEPCLVASNGSTLTTGPGQLPDLAKAYAFDPRCVICGRAIASIEDAAYLSTRDRVVHADRCFSQYVINTYRSERIGTPSLELDDELGRAIDRFCSDAPEYATVRAPILFVGSQKCTFKHRLLNVIDVAPAHIVIDMTETRFIDSSGLGVLLSARHKFRQVTPAGHVVLVGINPEIRALLDLTRLESMFRLAPTMVDVEALLRD